MKIAGFFLLLCIFALPSSFAFLFPASQQTRNQLKSELLRLSSETKRGLVATPEQTREIERLFCKLEKLNPTKAPLKSPLVNGDWSLEYTTSASILGKGDIFPKVGPIVQTIDTETLSAKNAEVVSYFGLRVPRQITAELDPQNSQFTNVQFKQFQIGPLQIKAPPSFKGALDVTYLDKDLRLSRGDKGNIFVLSRM